MRRLLIAQVIAFGVLFTVCVNAEAVVPAPSVNKKNSISVEINQSLQDLNSAAKTVISKMDRAQDPRRFRMQKLQYDLKQILRTESVRKEKPYCSPKIAMVLGENC